ncbi:Mannose-1-phosphate guanyltransferase [Paramicrosporidium saccamoebae]|uniref:mannose-1-phosphate guanylyltransferase n=1 Tax=Paramicrosporidium saccamoebae TaxID=1246581 RepID=A0A2H9TL11_9FUNG|nr:Mannose-1-phosphate guanyltransferase [Paramicrosporidium saccamoebae]
MHQIESLAKAGVTDVVLAVNYRPEIMQATMKEYEEKLGLSIHFSVESEPLGTAGPLALAKEILGKDEEPFFVLNSDIICDFPFEEMVAFHKKHGAEGTILVTKVEEPSKYGVIVTAAGTTQIESFVEKPKEFVGDRINAGIYIFNPKILDRIQPKPTSIEKEVFPDMAKDGELHSMDLKGYWMDVGQPKDYLIGLGLYLGSLAEKKPQNLHKGECVKGNVLVDSTAQIGKGCLIGPNVTVGANVIIEDGARISNSAVMEGARIKSHAFVSSTIIGWRATVGSWSRVEGGAVLGDDVAVGDELYVNGAIVLPNKTLSTNIATPQIIM